MKKNTLAIIRSKIFQQLADEFTILDLKLIRQTPVDKSILALIFHKTQVTVDNIILESHRV
jgi:hypothetical protein